MEKKEYIIYQGPRDKSFVDMIRNVLRRGKLKDAYINRLTNSENIKIYNNVFTHPSADSNHNYEFYEKLGDATANKSIVWYFSRRFPQINCPKGVKILARLAINYGSKKSFFHLGTKLGFWPFITATEDIRSTKMQPATEDCFEAFLGATEQLLDIIVIQGVGYDICYNIIASLFDEMDISLKYEDLFDAKTRLKELFNYMHWPSENYEGERDENLRLRKARVYGNVPGKGRKVLLGQGIGSLKIKAEQDAAKQALQYLGSLGYSKSIPPEYFTFCKF